MKFFIMTELEVFLTLAFIHFVAVISPGPDVTLIVRYSLGYGRRIAVPAALGIGSGIFVHVMYSILGLGILIATHPLVFSILKLIGASYLLFIAYQGWFSASSQKDKIQLKEKRTPARIKAFRTGFLTNALNIKATIFFFSLFILFARLAIPLRYLYGGGDGILFLPSCLAI